MKMKNMFTMKTLAAATVVGILGMASCAKNDDILNAGDTQNVNSESVSETSTSETADMTNSVMSNVNDTKLGEARVAGVITGLGDVDGRLSGATITVSGTGGKSNPSGTITIDFGTGTTDPRGVVRKGVITITYAGRRLAQNSTRQINYTNYSRNGVAFDNGMQFLSTNITADSTGTTFEFHHQLTGGLLTFPDETTVHRIADYNVTLDLTAETLTLSASDATHSASGTTRASKDYHMDITAPIVYKASCIADKFYFPASGTKSITVNNTVTYTIDYGTGTCDNTVTITLGGKSKTITVNSDGN
jgi:hypothetical protein